MEQKNDIDSFFKIDPELHLTGTHGSYYSYFPGYQMWWQAIHNIARPLFTGTHPKLLEQYAQNLEEWEMKQDPSPENIIRAMDKYGVDIACLLPESCMDTCGNTGRFCTNGEMADT